MFKELLAAIGIELGLLVAGFLGALTSVQVIQEVKTFKQTIWIIFCGTASAMYFTPAAALMIGAMASTPAMKNGLAFFIGMFGLTASNALYVTLKETKFGEALSTWLRKRGS